jgi:ParB family transcriptional regulator, chromosome partitioning protein
MIQKQEIPSLEEALSGTLFGTMPQSSNQIVMIHPDKLIEIENQPFRPYPPEKLAELAADIKENGQISPCTVRKKDGKYFVLSGRNRKRACKMAGVKVACIVIECDDPTANLILVNSNLNQRQELLPSEKAFAYKLQKESYKAKGQRKTAAAVAEQNSENVKMIQRYIKLTKLTRPLLNMVDTGRLPIMVGVQLAYLPPNDLQVVSDYLEHHSFLSVSVAQAQMIRKLSPVSTIELDRIFGSSDDSEQEKSNIHKQSKAPASVSIKISDLKRIGIDFDFDKASPAQIRAYILRSLETLFRQV